MFGSRLGILEIQMYRHHMTMYRYTLSSMWTGRSRLQTCTLKHVVYTVEHEPKHNVWLKLDLLQHKRFAW